MMMMYEIKAQAVDDLAKALQQVLPAVDTKPLAEALRNFVETMIAGHEDDYYHNRRPEY